MCGVWAAGLLELSSQVACRQARDRFEAFYHKRHTGRKLIWQATKGTGEIVALYTKRQHIFVVCLFCVVYRGVL
jgi:hypothetical protein